MRYTNIIHLSDLHLKNTDPEKHNQSVILDALIEDIEEISDSQLRPDCIIFSGDLVNDADEVGIIEEASTLLRLIASAANLDESRVFLCPGNHDASRTIIGPKIPLVKELRSSVRDITTLNKIAGDFRMIDHVSSVFGNFSKIQSQFGIDFLTHSDALVTQYFIRDLQLSVICINTAALTGAGLSTDAADERRLIFPEISLSKAIKRAPQGSQVVLVGHHPLGHLTEAAEQALKPLIYGSVDLMLSGHLHNAAPISIIAPQGNCTLVQAGSLYASREWWNGYTIASSVPGSPHHRLTYRKWHEQRRKFGISSDLDDDGIVYSSPEARIFWSSVTPKMDYRKLEKWRTEKLLPQLDDDFGQDFADMCSQGTFVEPEFERDNYIETENGLEKTTKPESVSLNTAISGHDNLVIMAGSESGKTTLIRSWAHRLAKTPINTTSWSGPVVIRFSEVRNYVKSIENLAKQRLSNLPDEISFFDLLESGMITIFVDDMDLRASDIKSAFDSFVQKYPSCRYILLTASTYLYGAGIAPVVVQNIPFSHLRLKELKNSQLLSLIESHGTKDPAQADRLLQRMKLEANSLNVPITPVTGTFLIRIYTEDSSQPLINRANLMERYIEISLEKFAPIELLPSSFDFHNKSDLLSFISEHMCRSGKYEIAEKEFINLISEYMDEFGLSFSSIDLLEYFVRARILDRSNGFITFRLNAFMEYFAANRMIGHDAFREWVLDESRYIAFCNEITFYAAISRKDKAWLEELFKRFQENSKSVWLTMPQDVQNGTLLETFKVPSESASEDDVLALEKQIFEESLQESERRELLDGEGPIAFQPPKAFERRLATDPGERWVSQLTLLSAMLKNMELVPSSLKKTILHEIIHGWLKFTALSMGWVPTLSKEKRLHLAGIDYLVLFPDSMEIGEVARRLFMYLPISTAKLASHHVGTEKLRLQLEDGIGDNVENLSASQQFFRATILAQLGVDGLSDIVKRASSSFSDKGYLTSVFVRMLSEIVVRFRLPESELRDIRALAADSIARLEGKTGVKAAARKGQIIEALSSNRRKATISSAGGDPEKRDN